MKPSERIHQLIGMTFDDVEWQERAIEAIIRYLDEDYDKACEESTKKFAERMKG